MGQLGGILRTFEGVLEVLERSWGASWVELEASWRRFGAILGRLGTLLGGSWEALEADRLNKESELKKNITPFFSFFLIFYFGAPYFFLVSAMFFLLVTIFPGKGQLGQGSYFSCAGEALVPGRHPFKGWGFGLRDFGSKNARPSFLGVLAYETFSRQEGG